MYKYNIFYIRDIRDIFCNVDFWIKRPFRKLFTE